MLAAPFTGYTEDIFQRGVDVEVFSILNRPPEYVAGQKYEKKVITKTEITSKNYAGRAVFRGRTAGTG